MHKPLGNLTLQEAHLQDPSTLSPGGPTRFRSAASTATCLITLAAFPSLPHFSTALPGFLGRLALEILSPGLLLREPKLSREKEDKAQSWWGQLEPPHHTAWAEVVQGWGSLAQMAQAKSSEFSVGLFHLDKDQQNKDLCSSLCALLVWVGPWTPALPPVHPHATHHYSAGVLNIFQSILSLHPHSPLTGPSHLLCYPGCNSLQAGLRTLALALLLSAAPQGSRKDLPMNQVFS